MHPFVVDANAIAEFQHERVSGGTDGAKTPVQDAMQVLLKNGFIAVDDNDNPLILAEWRSCASHSNSTEALDAWISNQMQEGKIKLLAIRDDQGLKKALRLDFRMPPKDHKYVLLASSVKAHSIVSNDIDFHAPEAKLAPKETKDKIRKEKSGPLYRFLKKEVGVLVSNWVEILDKFGGAKSESSAASKPSSDTPPSSVPSE